MLIFFLIILANFSPSKRLFFTVYEWLCLLGVERYPIPIKEFRGHCDHLGLNTGLGYQEEYEVGVISTKKTKTVNICVKIIQTFAQASILISAWYK